MRPLSEFIKKKNITCYIITLILITNSIIITFINIHDLTTNVYKNTIIILFIIITNFLYLLYCITSIIIIIKFLETQKIYFIIIISIIIAILYLFYVVLDYMLEVNNSRYKKHDLSNIIQKIILVLKGIIIIFQFMSSYLLYKTIKLNRIIFKRQTNSNSMYDSLNMNTFNSSSIATSYSNNNSNIVVKNISLNSKVINNNNNSNNLNTSRTEYDIEAEEKDIVDSLKNKYGSNMKLSVQYNLLVEESYNSKKYSTPVYSSSPEEISNKKYNYKKLSK